MQKNLEKNLLYAEVLLLLSNQTTNCIIMIEPDEIKERRRKIIQSVREYYTSRLGKYTHQRISEEWFFYGLGFVKDDMTYVFGFNAGFFKKESVDNMAYSHVGCNVLVRTNGMNPQLRTQYLKFFRHELADWITEPEQGYSSFRGGVGSVFAHYRAMSSFYSDDDVIRYVKEGLDGIFRIYPAIASNPDGIFDNVVCMNTRNESIIDLVNSALNK